MQDCELSQILDDQIRLLAKRSEIANSEEVARLTEAMIRIAESPAYGNIEKEFSADHSISATSNAEDLSKMLSAKFHERVQSFTERQIT